MTIIEELLKLIIWIIDAVFSLFGEIIETAIGSVGKRKHAYTANFTSERDLLSRSGRGFCLTGTRSLSPKDSHTNALIAGGTGVGKSSVVLLPSLYKMSGSFIVHDPSGELFTKSAGYLTEKGYDVKVLNFSKPDISAGYNPLARAKTASDIQKVAAMLVKNALGGGKEDPFWNNQAISLLAMLITILKTQPEQYQNLYNVRQLLNQLGGNPKGVDTLFSQYADPVLFAEYKSFLAFDDKVQSGMIATCKASVQLFADTAVAAVTSTDTLPFEDFRAKPTALFIQNSIADQKYYSVLTSLYFEQCFSYVLSRFPDNDEQDIFFLIDEAASLKFLTLPIAAANVRKHRAGIMLLVQDYNQLVSNYGKQDAEAIRANCFARMYFTGASLENAKEISETMGSFDYKDEQQRTVTRPLMTADEIRTMDMRRALLICGHHAPIKARLRPYYKRSVFLAYSQIEPPVMRGAGMSSLSVLPLETPTDENTEEA